MTLVQRLQRDRETRLMTWSDYARFTGLSEATLYKIVAGSSPSRLTQAKLRAAWDRPFAEEKATA